MKVHFLTGLKRLTCCNEPITLAARGLSVLSLHRQWVKDIRTTGHSSVDIYRLYIISSDMNCFVVHVNEGRKDMFPLIMYYRRRRNSICLKFINQTELCPTLCLSGKLIYIIKP